MQNNSKKLLAGSVLPWLLCFFLAPAVSFGGDADNELSQTPSRFRLTYEELEVSDHETMGFGGGTFLYDINDFLSVGGASYGAISGDRGGFITLGLAAELKKEIRPAVEINSGIFIGAGGGRGGYSLSGGGLMLRYHLGGEYKSEIWGNIGAGLSYVDFPDGTIHSFQPYIVYEYPFYALIEPGWSVAGLVGQQNSSRSVPEAEQEFSLLLRSYSIPSDVLTANGNPQNSDIRLVGAQWNRYLDDNLFLQIEADGAMGGNSSGYMQVLMGLGYRQPIMPTTSLKVASTLGFAGGGNVATGGGFIIDAEVTMQQKLIRNIYAEISAGYVVAPDDSFEAASLSGELGYSFHTPDLEGGAASSSDLAGFKPMYLRIRTTNQFYYKDDPGWRDHHNDENVDLLGFQFDYFATENYYLTGQAMAAYHGMAGAYMAGLVGAGVHIPWFESPAFIECEGLVGAAGGGGLDVNGGLVWQATTGVGWQFSDSYSLLGSYGYMRAPDGNFKARLASLSFVYRFGVFVGM